MSEFIATYGLVVVFVAVALESAGVPMPGETSVIAASVLAAHGGPHLGSVIVVAATGAILGDNLGYWAGRYGARRLLRRSALLRRHAARVLPKTERFFARYGGAAVLLARFVPGVRVAAAWMAGTSRMDWWRFLFWNAAGGVVWAAVVGLAGDALGRAALDVLSRIARLVSGV